MVAATVPRMPLRSSERALVLTPLQSGRHLLLQRHAARASRLRKSSPRLKCDAFLGLFKQHKPAAPAPAGNGKEVILQAFNWDSHQEQLYDRLKTEVNGLARSGVTTVWLPPPTASVSPQGYMPTSLYDLDSQYGSADTLRELVDTAHHRKMKVVLDIVLNHRCANDQDEHGTWNVYSHPPLWDKSVITHDSPGFRGMGAASTGKVYAAAPNIDHTQDRVQQDYAEWLRWLKKSTRADGWRLDFVTGFDARYLSHYLDQAPPMMAIGEFWGDCSYNGDGTLSYDQERHRQELKAWVGATGGRAAAFDFTTKGILQEAVKRNERWRLVDPSGQPPGMIGTCPSHSVTFIENHDTGSSLGHWPFPHEHLQEGYAYVLTHPGTPCVFHDHFFSPGLGDSIRSLIRVRKENRIHATSQVRIHHASHRLYAATIDGRVHVKCGSGDWTPAAAGLPSPDSWRIAAHGHNFCVWTKTSGLSWFSDW